MTPLRRRMAAAALVLAAPAVAACGFNVQTDKVYQAAVGVDDRSGSVDVLNAMIVSSTDGEGRFLATLVNKSTKESVKLISIKLDGSNSGAESLLGTEIAREGILNLADSTAPVTFSGDALKPGGFVKVTLSLSNGQETTVNAPVVSPDSTVAEFPSEEPSPSQSPSQSPSPSASETPSN